MIFKFKKPKKKILVKNTFYIPFIETKNHAIKKILSIELWHTFVDNLIKDSKKFQFLKMFEG